MNIFTKLAMVLSGLTLAAAPALKDWTQWAGPNGNFTVEADALAESWPAGGPKKLWSRDLGDGYSSIVSEAGTLYTMHRRGDQDVTLALDAATGKTKWEHANTAAFTPQMMMENGPGPHTTPLVLGDKVFSIGLLAVMHAYDKKTGKVVWSKNLYKDFPGSTFQNRGFSPSPIAYKNTIIVKLGGANHAIVALNPANGSVVWQKHSYENAPSTPLVASVNGQDQLITTFADEAVGLNANTGDLLWSHPHKTRWGLNISTPLYGPDNIVFLTSAYDGGARAIQLNKEGNKTVPKELWASNRMRVHIGTTLRVGDTVYGSSGDFGPAPMTAVDIKSGKVLWQDRAFAKANLISAGGKTMLLDEEGILALVQLSPQGMKVVSKQSLFTSNTWTPPTVVGTKLYARDRKTIAAFELK